MRHQSTAALLDSPLKTNIKRRSPGHVKKTLQRVHRQIYTYFKQLIDILLATVGLVILSPLLLLIALAIHLDTPGPVIFRQKRTGKGGKEFDILKFRTMTDEKRPKHTKVGLFLRKTSLDELPQLINVVRGEMAFIGPRPWMVEYYANMNRRERGRTKVLPGITGLAQVNGRNDLTVFEKINFDLQYVKHYSLHQDVKIVLLTVKTILTHAGAVARKGYVSSELRALQAENSPVRG